jgi:signal transduction histidine kinase
VVDTATLAPARTLLLLRLLALYPVALSWQHTRPDAVELTLVAVLVSSTSLLVLRWNQIAPFLRRHPGIAGLDVVVSLVVLAYAGPTSTFVAYTLTSAALVGLLFARLAALLLWTLLASGYLLLRTLAETRDTADLAVLGVPFAYALLTSAGAAFRSLHDRLRAALDVAVAAERSVAAADERTRLARDLHDGVSSTLHGLVLQSMAVSRTADRVDPKVAALARDLEGAARIALAQSREVLTGLRREDDSAPLVQAVADRSRRWSEQTGVRLTFGADGVGDVDAPARVAMLRVLDEALENVRRHARARQVVVRITGDRDRIALIVQDDGCGLPQRLRGERGGVRDGHYGVVGMMERADAVGAQVHVEPVDAAHGSGTRVRLELPRALVPRAQGVGA